MRHHVYDTNQQSQLLIAADYPTRLQPWRRGAAAPPSDSWQIKRSNDGVVAEVKGKGDDLDWIRYFHRYPTQTEWSVAQNKGKLDGVDPYSCRLVADYYGYDCYIQVPSNQVYDTSPFVGAWKKPPFDGRYESGESLTQFRGSERFGNSATADHGLNWVSDLIFEANVQLGADCTELVLEIVECGLQYQCRVDTKTGKAKLAIIDDDTLVVAAAPGDVAVPASTENAKSGTPSFDGAGADAAPTADTNITAGKSVEIRFSNCDDELLLWVDNKLIKFDTPTTFRMSDFRTVAESYPRYSDGEHPLDGAPIGIAVRGSASVDRIRVYRDKYYCATKNSSQGIFDYEIPGQWGPTQKQRKSIQLLMATPNAWQASQWWQRRREVSFETEADQFFPMGDNSPESQDARCWAGVKNGRRLPERFQESAYKYANASYVPRDLLVGKALLVFWPHHWQSPVPYPNLGRIRLIR